MSIEYKKASRSTCVYFLYFSSSNVKEGWGRGSAMEGREEGIYGLLSLRAPYLNLKELKVPCSTTT